MNKKQFFSSGIIEQYILGLTNEQESEMVREYADEYPEVREEIERMQEAMQQYIALQELPKLSSSKIEPIEPVQQPARSSRYAILIASLIAIVAISALAYQRSVTANLEAHKANLTEAVSECRQYSHALKQELVPVKKLGLLLQEPDTRLVRMHHTEQHRISACIYENNRLHKAYLQVFNLPKAPRHHHYQVWGIQDSLSHALLSFHTPHPEQILSLSSELSFGHYVITLEAVNAPSTPDTQHKVAQSVTQFIQ